MIFPPPYASINENHTSYGVMVRVSTETASPLAVITAIRPVVPPAEEIDETGMVKVFTSTGVVTTILFLQNFTVTDPEKPVPVIVKVPPAAKEILSVDSPVMDGGSVAEISSDVAPLRAIVAPLPTWPVG